jgi:GNAT superfamily N-acetyltransferase
MSSGPRDSWRHELALLREELHALDVDIASARAAAARGRRGTLSFRHQEHESARVYGEPVRLADGAQIVIRPIEPEDAGELRRGLRRLSALTAYRRFRAHITTVSPEQLDYLTRIDHVRHEALAALDPQVGSVAGVVRYVCDPTEPSQAELTHVVADAWQHRGVGSALIDRLAERAHAAGVERFIVTTLAVDAPARRLLTRVAEPISERDQDGLIETTARLRPPARPHPSNPDTPHTSPAS